MRKILIAVVIFMAILIPAGASEWVSNRITNDPLKEDWPMGITPDGRKILYISETDYNDNSNWDLELFLADLTTEEVTRITYNMYGEIYAGISDDGDTIAYLTEKLVVNSWGMYSEIIEVNVAELSENSWNHRSIAYFEKNDCRRPLVQISGDGEVIVVGCDTTWYVMDSSGHNLRELPRAYPYGRVSGDWFVYAPDTKFYQSESNVYPSRLATLNLPDTSGSSYYAEEDEYLGRSFDISSDGKLAFLLLSLERYNDTGIYQYGKNLIVHKYTGFIYPPYDRIRISGDGSKVFYQGWNDTTTNPHSVIYEVLNGKLELIEGRLFLGDVDREGNRILAKWLQNGYSDIFVLSRTGIQPFDLNLNLNFNINAMPAFSPETTLIFQSSASSGGEIQIPVLIKNANSLGSFDLRLEYPSEVLEAIDVIPGSLTQDSLFEYNIKNGMINIGMVNTNGINGDGSLLYVKFRVEERPGSSYSLDRSSEILNDFEIRGVKELDLNAKFADTSLLLIKDAVLNDINGSEIDVTTINGTFKFLKEDDVKKGDVNGDGKITSIDALLALQMSVGKLEASVTADMNGDGKTTAADAFEILEIAVQQISIKILGI